MRERFPRGWAWSSGGVFVCIMRLPSRNGSSRIRQGRPSREGRGGLSRTKSVVQTKTQKTRGDLMPKGEKVVSSWGG